MAPVGFAAFTDADWWQFGIDIAVGVGTLAAVAVAVTEMVLATRRARRAERDRADEAARANALESVRQANRPRDAEAAERFDLEAKLAIDEYWLSVAQQYGDTLRAAQLTADIAAKRARLGIG